MESRLLLTTLSAEGKSPWAPTLSPDGRYAAVDIGGTCVFDVVSGSKLGCLGKAVSSYFSGDGTYFVLGGSGFLRRIANDSIGTSNETTTIKTGPDHFPHQWHVDATGRYVYYITGSALMRVDFEAPDMPPQEIARAPANLMELAMAADRSHFATRTANDISLYSAASGKLLKKLKLQDGAAPGKMWLGRGGLHVVLHQDKLLRRFDTKTGATLSSWPHPRGPNTCNTMLPDGRFLLTVPQLAAPSLLDLEGERTSIAYFPAGADDFPEMTLATDGRILLPARQPLAAHVYNLISGEDVLPPLVYKDFLKELPIVASSGAIAVIPDVANKDGSRAWALVDLQTSSLVAGAIPRLPILSHTAKWLAAHSSYGQLSMMSLPDSAEAAKRKVPSTVGNNSRCSFSTDESRIACYTSSNKAVEIIELSSGDTVGTVQLPSEQALTFLSRDLLGTRESHGAKGSIYHVNTAQDLIAEHRHWALCADGQHVVVAGKNGYLARANDLSKVRDLGNVPGGPLMACSHAGKHVAVARNTELTIWNSASQSTIVQHSAAHHEEIRRLTMNERFIVSMAQDGFAKVWRPDPGELLVSVARAGGNYAAVTPEGYYMASRGAHSILAFNYQGRAYGFEQFDIYLNRPDIVTARLGASPAVVSAYHSAYERRLARAAIASPSIADVASLPSVSLITTPPTAHNARRLRFELDATSLHGLSHYTVHVNGVPEMPKADFQIKGATKNDRRTLDIELSQGKNAVAVRVWDTQVRESLARTFEVVHTPKNKAAPPPNLYVLAVGVSNYGSEEWDLRYAAKDARDFVKALTQGNKKYSTVHSKVLTDKKVTRASLAAAKAHFAKATHDDVVVLFVAGHGFLDDKDTYYFGTSDVNPHQPAERGVPYSDLNALFSSSKSRRRLVLLDTCHSGEVDREADALPSTLPSGVVLTRGLVRKTNTESFRAPTVVRRMLSELFADLERGAGATVLASSSGLQFALESSEYKNGVFTFALLQALGDGAKSGGVQDVTVSWMQAFVRARVYEMTQGLQRPNVRAENISTDYSLFSLWK